MYNNGCSYTYNFGYDPVPQSTPNQDQDLDLDLDLDLEFEASNMYGSSCSGSPSSNSIGAFERSFSLLKPNATSSSSLLVLPEDSHDAPFRRVFSAGDLDSVNSYMARRRTLQRGESPLSISNENSLIIEGIMKATKYTPQEKKERIERYRNKRNQRNFHKKIQYTCRKTLADSRPRIKGRFVRNDEVSTSMGNTTMMTTDGDYTTSNSCYEGDQYSSSLHYHHQQQQHMMNLGEELEDGCEENTWINLFDCSFPFPSSQYEH